MGYAERMDAKFCVKEVYLAWLMFSKEFGNDPGELARLEKVKARTGELVFDEIQRDLNIPSGNPFTVVASIGEYLTRSGYAKYKFQKISDTDVIFDSTDLVSGPIMPELRSRGLKVSPTPSDVLFDAALKKLCNMTAEPIDVPAEIKASTPEGTKREVWRFSPID